jgi:hypothetical protein
MWISQFWNLIASSSLADWANFAAIVGMFAAAAAVFYAASQIRQNTKISRGQFWLELEKMFSQHDEVHIKLRPGGEWTSLNAGPKTPEDWAKVEDYMGLFEHCELMLRKGLIDWETFEAIFSYRLHNIVANKIIVDAKLRQKSESWQAFIRLLKRLKITVPEQITKMTIRKNNA